MSEDTKVALAAAVGSRVLGAIFATLDYRVSGAENLRLCRDSGRPIVFTLWHGRLLPLMYHHRNQGVVGLVSRSADGSYIAAILERLGFETARGSSSRGGTEALRELVRLARAGKSLAITPDGPRGPRQVLKPGALVAAQLSGGLVLPVTAGASDAWYPGRWDRFLVPKPFARIHVRYGTPREIPRGIDERELERHALEIQDELNRMTADVDASF